MNTNVQYRFGLGTDNQVVDINDLTTADRQDYQCASCGTVLRPVLGEHRQKHFRHKALVDCSEETYLHRVGKYLFYQEYQKCLRNVVPFNISFLRPRICNACKDFGPCIVPTVLETHDLTKYYKHIELEKFDEGFVPDVLLNSEKGDKLYVEIAVTHRSEKSKRYSNVRIIELSVACEDDLNIIQQHHLSHSDERIEFINFQIKEKPGKYPGVCETKVFVFILYPSGKSRVESITRFEYPQMIREPKHYYALVPSLGTQDYIIALEKAYLSGHYVKNCYLCRHHVYKEKQVWELRKHSMFCKHLKTYKNSNDAAKCEAYCPDKMAFERNRSHLGQ